MTWCVTTCVQWVDEVVEGAPYVTDVGTTRWSAPSLCTPTSLWSLLHFALPLCCLLAPCIYEWIACSLCTMLLCSPRADILKKHDITWCIHGDDLVTTGDGEDTYGKVKAAGLFKYVVRPVY